MGCFLSIIFSLIKFIFKLKPKFLEIVFGLQYFITKLEKKVLTLKGTL